MYVELTNCLKNNTNRNIIIICGNCETLLCSFRVRSDNIKLYTKNWATNRSCLYCGYCYWDYRWGDTGLIITNVKE